jgi:hypothetical protein
MEEDMDDLEVNTEEEMEDRQASDQEDRQASDQEVKPLNSTAMHTGR